MVGVREACLVGRFIYFIFFSWVRDWCWFIGKVVIYVVMEIFFEYVYFYAVFFLFGVGSVCSFGFFVDLEIMKVFKINFIGY